MPKKIYDIKPPRLAKKSVEKPKEISGAIKVKKIQRSSVEPVRRRLEKKERSIWVPVSISALVIVLVLGIYLFFKLPKADILIWPKVETLSFKQTITADKSVDSINIINNIIPVQYFQATKTNSQNFPATGNASNEGYASGNITIYNKYDPPTPFNFKTGTHFMSDSGKLFITYQKVAIPAAKKSGSKITPGSVQIQVQAVEGGTDYNIAPSNFSIPGLKGTSYYYGVYAVSSSAMTGGYAGEVKKVTTDDIASAKDVLIKKTTLDAITDLKAQIPSDYIILGPTGDPTILSNVTNASTSTKAGTVIDNFNYEVTVATSALAFKKSDIEQFAKNYIISKIPEGKTLLDDSFVIDYSASVVDVSGGKATVNLDFSSGVYQNINKNSITLSLLGKNADQIKAIVDNSLGDQVSKVQTKFWPFWVFFAPNNQKAIDIELKF